MGFFYGIVSIISLYDSCRETKHHFTVVLCQEEKKAGLILGPAMNSCLCQTHHRLVCIDSQFSTGARRSREEGITSQVSMMVESQVDSGSMLIVVPCGSLLRMYLT